jgi:DNA-binding response OmpR family regulator
MGRHALMLIEDEEDVRRSLGDALRHDYDIATAESGEEAIEKMKKRNVDLVLLDVQLPGMSSLTVLRIIKNIDNSIPVIILSHGGNVDTVVQGFRYGVWDYFYKPYSISALKASVAAAMQREAGLSVAEGGETRYGREEDSIVVGAGAGSERNLLPIDMEELIRDTLEYSLRRRTGLQSALQRFREKYIDLLERKMPHM